MAKRNQHTGFTFFTHLKNILISFVAAQEAIRGNMTLGALLSISYIIGQTNGPLEQLVAFVKAAQDMDRLQETHNKGDEESEGEIDQIHTPVHETIELKDISFQYGGPHSSYVLKNVNLSIPKGKVTAIVGSSGSGKTTLMKLLLNFYSPVSGSIAIGKNNLSTVSPKWWRNQCGTVMQEGVYFL